MAYYSGRFISSVLFIGILNDETSEIEQSELDSDAFNLDSEIERLQPGKSPKLSVDYLSENGNAELIFTFKITWEDRTSDIEDYLDEVQEVIEANLDLLISERQQLGIKSD